jgi:hypothetical protein
MSIPAAWSQVPDFFGTPLAITLNGRFFLDGGHPVGESSPYSHDILGSRTPSFIAGGTGAPGTPVIARPFFNAFTNQQDAERVAFPGQLGGTVAVDWSSRLQGAELNGVTRLGGYGFARLDLLAGFRYLQLDEGLGIREDLNVNPTFPQGGGSHIDVADQFDTHNRFYGGQLGARVQWQRERLFVNVLGKVALGVTHEVIGINGTTVFTTPGGTPTAAQGGLLALPSNSGHSSRDQFAVLPEVGVSVGYQITETLRLSLGYTFLYVSSVVRPGDQIDLRVDSRQLPVNGGTMNGSPNPLPAVLYRGRTSGRRGSMWGWNFGTNLAGE